MHPRPDVPLGPALSSIREEPEPGSWADTAGMKVLGWIGGAVTVLGIVLLLTVAVQQGLLGPLARVLIGVVLAVLLTGGAAVIHSRPRLAALAVTLGCTGLAVGYLTAIGAVRMAHLVPAVVGLAGSALIVAVAIALARSWSAPWLAGVTFCVSGLLAPAVGDGATGLVLVFETIMVAGAAVCVLLGVGLSAWIGAASAGALIFLIGMSLHSDSSLALLMVVLAAAVTWAMVLFRWIAGRAATDPGPFPLRTPSNDPAQVARDYADFHAHQRERGYARFDHATSTTSLAVAAGLLVFALAVFSPPSGATIAVGVMAAVIAVLMVALAAAGQQLPALSRTPSAVISWCTALALAAVALDRLLNVEARSMAWLLLAAAALAGAAAGRTLRLLMPALIGAVLALALSGPALDPADLLGWPATGLVDAAGLAQRGWQVVLPAGVAVIALAAVAWWAVARCTEAVGDAPASAHRGTLLRWAMVSCIAVACYGMLAIVMVVAYAISATRSGYQGGQVAVTVLITVIALGLLWQGFRRTAFRVGGLVLAGVAIAKLLLLDTGSLEALPRAMTFTGVGILLLVAALLYLRALARVDAGDAPTPEAR